jgi:hypothetical protein
MNFKGCFISDMYNHDGKFTIYGFDHVISGGFDSVNQAVKWLNDMRA